MEFAILLVASSVGLTAVFTAFAHWRHRSGSTRSWLVSRRGLGALCVLAAGAGLVVGSHFLLGRWLLMFDAVLDLQNPVVTTFILACLMLLAIGATLLALGRPAGTNTSSPRKISFAWSLALALIVTLVELSAFQVLDPWDLPNLPHVALDVSGTTAKASEKPYQFVEGTDWVSRVSATWEKALADYKGKPDVRYLEIGLFEGRSAVWMLENILTHPTARLTGIDPFSDPFYSKKEPQSRTYKQVFYANLKASGGAEKADIIEGFSQIELHKLPLDTYDIIYIDGSHEAPDVLEDAILAWRLLKDGGVLILDDYGYTRGLRQAIHTFYSFYGNHFTTLHVGWQVILRKNPPQGRSSLVKH